MNKDEEQKLQDGNVKDVLFKACLDFPDDMDGFLITVSTPDSTGIGIYGAIDSHLVEKNLRALVSVMYKGLGKGDIDPDSEIANNLAIDIMTMIENA